MKKANYFGKLTNILIIMLALVIILFVFFGKENGLAQKAQQYFFESGDDYLNDIEQRDSIRNSVTSYNEFKDCPVQVAWAHKEEDVFVFFCQRSDDNCDFRYSTRVTYEGDESSGNFIYDRPWSLSNPIVGRVIDRTANVPQNLQEQGGVAIDVIDPTQLPPAWMFKALHGSYISTDFQHLAYYVFCREDQIKR